MPRSRPRRRARSRPASFSGSGSKELECARRPCSPTKRVITNSAGSSGALRSDLLDFFCRYSALRSYARDLDPFLSEVSEMLHFGDVFLLRPQPIGFLQRLSGAIQRDSGVTDDHRILPSFLIGIASVFQGGITHRAAADRQRSQERQNGQRRPREEESVQAHRLIPSPVPKSTVCATHVQHPSEGRPPFSALHRCQAARLTVFVTRVRHMSRAHHLS